MTALTLWSFGLATFVLGASSRTSLALVRLGCGLWLGHASRHRLSEHGFRRLLFVFLTCVAIALLTA